MDLAQTFGATTYSYRFKSLISYERHYKEMTKNIYSKGIWGAEVIPLEM